MEDGLVTREVVGWYGTMHDGGPGLLTFETRHPYLVGVDSDGCVFDSMEIKQKECFIPITIDVWGLKAIAGYERQAHEFVNLYSRWRGTNRFPALIKVFDLLAEREEVKQSGFQLPDITSLRQWVDSGVALGEPSLEAIVDETHDPVLSRALSWSRAINEEVRRVATDVQPFPFAPESLASLQGLADVVCISATPHEALEREWMKAGLRRMVAAIAGQEVGPKRKQLELFSAGRYLDGRVLMVGDALGDLEAARQAGVLFYPILPGQEGASWRRFNEVIIDLFLKGEYTRVEAEFIAQFETALPERPPWR